MIRELGIYDGQFRIRFEDDGIVTPRFTFEIQHKGAPSSFVVIRADEAELVAEFIKQNVGS